MGREEIADGGGMGESGARNGRADVSMGGRNRLLKSELC